jgi:hypothetical protein
LFWISFFLISVILFDLKKFGQNFDNSSVDPTVYCGSPYIDFSLL